MQERISTFSSSFIHVAQKHWHLALVFLIFLALQWHKAFHLAPPPEYIWDNVFLWDWARNFIHGDFETFKANSHHMLRWGNWGFASLIIAFFSDEIVFYYLATLIPSTLAGLIFCYIAYRYIGFWSAIIFCLLFYFDRELFRASFQLLPTGSTLLPLAVTLLLSIQVIEKRHLSMTYLVLLSLSCFWIYGTKETYLAFVPGVLFILHRYGGWRAIGIFMAICSVGYVIETVFYSFISDDFSKLGRVWMLIHNGHHLNLMFNNPEVVANQTKYFDSGLTLRWITPLGLTMILFFPAFLFALLCQSEQPIIDGKKQYLPQHAISLMLLSFIVFTTFFISSLSPLRLGQPLMSRYVAINIPLAYLMILWFLSLQFQAKSWKIKLAAVAMLPFFLSHSLHRHLGYADVSILNHSHYYNSLAKQLEEHDCAKSKTLSIVRNRLDLIPFKHRSDKLSAMINQENHYIDQQGWFTIQADPTIACSNPYYIKRVLLTRF